MIMVLFALSLAGPEAAPAPVAGVTVERPRTKAEIKAEKKRIANDPNRIICRKGPPTGSRLPVEDCRTKAQMDAEEAEFRRDRDRMMLSQDPGGLLGRR